MTSHVCVAITFHGQWITFRAVHRVQASDFVPRALAMMNGGRRSGVGTWAVIGSQHALCNAGTTWLSEKTDGKVLRENLLVEHRESLILQLQRMLMTSGTGAQPYCFPSTLATDLFYACARRLFLDLHSPAVKTEAIV